MIVNNTSELSFWDKNWTKNSKSLGYSMSEFLTHKIAAMYSTIISTLNMESVPKITITYWPKNDAEKWSRKNIFEILRR